MKKQKICIIGGSITGLVTAIGLSKLNCNIDLFMGKQNSNLKSHRTIAISQDNYDFLKNLNILKSLNKKELWPCSKMKLYTQIENLKLSEVFDLNNDNRKKQQILYMSEYSRITKSMESRVKKIKSISLIQNKKISKIINSGLLQSVKFKHNYSKYNLIIVCTGSNSDLVKNLFNKGFIDHSYGEMSITTMLKHSSIKNNTARQVFLDNGILALLPISNTRTSIVWSVKKDLNKKNDFIIKNKIKLYTKKFLKKTKFISKIEYVDLKFLIRNKYYENRTLLFGDALHVVHPFAGQGFNMILRDLYSLIGILENKINLGLDIGSSDILSEFTEKTKSRNFIHSISIDFLKDFFSFKNNLFNKFRYSVLKNLNNNNYLKDRFLNVANKGFKF